MHSARQPNAFYVPTIDVAPYLEDPGSAAADKIIDEVRTACISTGFFQIIGHGIPKHLQQSVFDAAANFFALPYDEKKKLDALDSVGHRGYDVLASQSYEEGVMPDLKEVSLLDWSSCLVVHCTFKASSRLHFLFFPSHHMFTLYLFCFVRSTVKKGM